MVDPRAIQERVRQEHPRVRSETISLKVRYPIEIQGVKYARCIAFGEEAPFSFVLKNISEREIGVSAGREAGMGVFLSLGGGKGGGMGKGRLLNPSDLLLRDKGGKVASMTGLFSGGWVVGKGEERVMSGTLEFVTPGLVGGVGGEWVKSVEVRGVLMLELLGGEEKGKEREGGGECLEPVQVVPFCVQLGQVFFFPFFFFFFFKHSFFFFFFLPLVLHF